MNVELEDAERRLEGFQSMFSTLSNTLASYVAAQEQSHNSLVLALKVFIVLSLHSYFSDAPSPRCSSRP
jgi:hypothetical protein